MKRILVIFCILLYSLAIVKPIMPSLAFALQYDQILEEWCENRDRPEMNCNGACYLAKSVKKASEGDAENPVNVPETQSEDFPITISKEFHFDSPVAFVEHIYLESDLLYAFEYVSTEFHPPRKRLTKVSKQA